jgi:hypothetical protein
MQNRTAKFASAILASLLAGAFLATISHGDARAAEDCLSGPKDKTPQGSHWYYRIDHASNRHCWYLRAESEKPSKTVASTSPPSENPTAPDDETAKLRSIADAHAELPMQTPVEQPRTNTPNPVPPANAAGVDNNQASNAGGTNMPSSVVASRWPDASEVASAANPVAASPLAASPLAASPLADVPQPATDHWATNVPSDPAAEPSPAAADVAPATASPAQGSSGSTPMLLAVLAGAVALAGITAGVIFKLNDWRRPLLTEVHARRNTIWEQTDHDGVVLSAQAAPRRRGFARDIDRGGGSDDRAAEFFSQLSHLSKRTPT